MAEVKLKYVDAQRARYGRVKYWYFRRAGVGAPLAGVKRERIGAALHRLLTTSKGKAFDPVYFGAWFADAIYETGLADNCVLHGLRKCAARKFAEAGCSEQEIMSVTGHRTTAMVAHYTKGANKKRQANAAILKLEKALSLEALLT